MATIVEALPADRLHLIPELLSEAVLGTKEVNERARDAAFDLLVVMGNRMKAGGWMQSEGHEQDEDMGDGGGWISRLSQLPLLTTGHVRRNCASERRRVRHDGRSRFDRNHPTHDQCQHHRSFSGGL